MPIELNKKYTLLTPVYELPQRTSSRGKIYHCICDCGKEIDVPGASLITKNTKSCGCLKAISAKKTGERIRTPNTYNMSEDVGVGYTTNTGREFYFDKEDYEIIKNYHWLEVRRGEKNYGYIYAKVWDHNKAHTMFLHRLVLEANGFDINSKDVDHVNHKTYDNRKSNLRICEHYENIIACKTYSNNHSGKKGVHYDKARNKWVARITINKTNKFLGRFDSFDEARAARLAAEKELHGEFHFEENNN